MSVSENHTQPEGSILQVIDLLTHVGPKALDIAATSLGQHRLLFIGPQPCSQRRKSVINIVRRAFVVSA
jgi:hypothetical protein